MHVLILGGTRDAMNLAGALLDHPKFSATYSLAGRTRRPLPSGLPTRRGGFGGVDGLSNYLKQHKVDVVVDATHPFAAQMSANAVAACSKNQLPLVRLSRQPWAAINGDHWLAAQDLPHAAMLLKQHSKAGDRVLLATGGLSLQHFEDISERHLIVRCVDPPQPPPNFDSWTLLTQRGPFLLADERQLLRAENIHILVCKNSGGKAAEAKLTAAQELGLPVIIVNRPEIPPADIEYFHYRDVIVCLERKSAG